MKVELDLDYLQHLVKDEFQKLKDQAPECDHVIFTAWKDTDAIVSQLTDQLMDTYFCDKEESLVDLIVKDVFDLAESIHDSTAEPL
jgi:hypothetical protein